MIAPRAAGATLSLHRCRRSALLALVVLLGSAGCTAPSPVDPDPRRSPAPVMSWHGAEWLERASREEEERPDLILGEMELRPGIRVAEVGAGTGYFSRRIAPLVAPARVVENDIQPEMLEILRTRLRKEEIPNVETVLGQEDDPGLAGESFDWILLVDVYHEFQQPMSMIDGINRALAPGGRVMLVEYRENADHIRSEHRMSTAQVRSEWEAAGFRIERIIESLPSQRMYILAPRRN